MSHQRKEWLLISLTVHDFSCPVARDFVTTDVLPVVFQPAFESPAMLTM